MGFHCCVSTYCNLDQLVFHVKYSQKQLEREWYIYVKLLALCSILEFKAIYYLQNDQRAISRQPPPLHHGSRAASRGSRAMMKRMRRRRRRRRRKRRRRRRRRRGRRKMKSWNIHRDSIFLSTSIAIHRILTLSTSYVNSNYVISRTLVGLESSLSQSYLYHNCGELEWCYSNEVFELQRGRGYFEQAEGGGNFVQKCQQRVSCNSRGVNPLLRRQLFLQRQWKTKIECDEERGRRSRDWKFGGDIETLKFVLIKLKRSI